MPTRTRTPPRPSAARSATSGTAARRSAAASRSWSCTKSTAPFSHDGIEITPIPVTHGDWTILGFRIGGFAYITDTNGIPPDSMRLLEGVDILALDGLRPGPRHPTHFTIAEAVTLRQKIGARETWLIHLAHEVDHEEVEATLPAGVRLAYDGLVLDL